MYIKLEGHTCLEYNRVLNIIDRCILSSKVILVSNIKDESSSKVILVSNIIDESSSKVILVSNIIDESSSKVILVSNIIDESSSKVILVSNIIDESSSKVILVSNIIDESSSKVILVSNIIDESSSKVILVSNIFRYSNNTLDALRQTTALSYEIDFDLVAALVSYIVLNKPVSQIYLFLFGMIDINLNKFCSSCCIKIVPTTKFNSIHDSMTLSWGTIHHILHLVFLHKFQERVISAIKLIVGIMDEILRDYCLDVWRPMNLLPAFNSFLLCWLLISCQFPPWNIEINYFCQIGAILIFVPGWEQIKKTMDSITSLEMFQNKGKYFNSKSDFLPSCILTTCCKNSLKSIWL